MPSSRVAEAIERCRESGKEEGARYLSTGYVLYPYPVLETSGGTVLEIPRSLAPHREAFFDGFTQATGTTLQAAKVRLPERKRL